MRSAPASRVLAVALLLVLVLLLAPLVATPYLPLLDAPSHQARLAVLHSLLVTGEGSAFYRLDTLFLPNMGFDLIGLLLASWFGPGPAGWLFFAAMLALTLGGVITLNRVVTGRWSLWPLVAALLSHNLYTLLGFFSFDLGVALVLWALAGRLWLMNRSLAVQLAVGSAFSVVLIICHLSAFGIYALMLAGVGIDMLLPRGLHSAPRIWERIGGLLSSIRHRLPRAIAMSLELVPACAVFAMMSTAGQGRARYDVPYWPSKIFNAVKTVSSGSEIGDVAFLLGAGAVGLLLIFCGRLRVARPLLPGLLFLIVVYFLMPAHMNSGSYVNSRLIMPILFLAVAAVQFDVRWDGVWRPRLIRALVAGICAALIVKQAALFVLWHQGGQTLARVGEALNALPSGAVILQAECQPDATDIRGVYEARQPPLSHAAALAAWSNSRFAAISWAIKGQHPIATAPDYLPYQRLQGDLGLEVCTPAQIRAAAEAARRLRAERATVADHTDPLFLLVLRPRTPEVLIDSADLLARTPEFELYKL